MTEEKSNYFDEPDDPVNPLDKLLPNGISVVLPGSVQYARVCKRMGLGEDTPPATMIRYDMRNMLTSAVFLACFGFHTLVAIATLFGGVTGNNFHFPFVSILVMCLLLYFFWDQMAGARWFLCMPDRLYLHYYLGLSLFSKTFSIAREEIAEIKTDNWGNRSNSIVLFDQRGKRTALIRNDSSIERVACLGAALRTRYIDAKR